MARRQPPSPPPGGEVRLLREHFHRGELLPAGAPLPDARPETLDWLRKQGLIAPAPADPE